MKKYLLFSTIALSAIATLALQVVALISLRPEAFGYFSIVYLASAFSLSIQLSFLSEAWGRSETRNIGEDWNDYSAVALYLAIGSGSALAVLALQFEALSTSWWACAIAASATIYRASSRYYSLRHQQWRWVFSGDLGLAVISIVGGILAINFAPGQLDAILFVWAASALCSALLSPAPNMQSPKVLTRWYKVRKTHIKALLKDSLIMDASSIGTPYVLAPMLGVFQFGIYRAVSNVASPVRLVLNPIRAWLPRIGKHRLTGSRALVAITLVSIAFGLLGAGALILIEHFSIELGTISALSAFAIPTGVFVASSFYGHGYYLICRYFSEPKKILIGRIVQTVLSIILPILGGLFGGLELAIWGYAVATLSSAITWSALARRV